MPLGTGLRQDIKQWQSALHPYPQASVWTEKGDALARQGMTDEAIDAYDKATGIDPNYAVAWEHLGDLYFTRHLYYPAENNYQRAVELDRTTTTFLYRYGKTLENQGYYSQAREQYRKAILIKPDDADLKKALQGLSG